MKRILILLASLLMMGNVLALPQCPSSAFKDNCYGVQYASGGSKYVGEFKGGKYHGRGTRTWPDGKKYVGEWKEDKMHGRGILTFSDGTKYIGEFKNDRYHGLGVYGPGKQGEYFSGEYHHSQVPMIVNGFGQLSIGGPMIVNGFGQLSIGGPSIVGYFEQHIYKPRDALIFDSTFALTGYVLHGDFHESTPIPTEWDYRLKKAMGSGRQTANRARELAEEILANEGQGHPSTSKEEEQPKGNDNRIVAASSGTGFFVSRSGHIITNHHVVEECKSVKVSFNGNEVDADVLAVDRYNDLAILKTTFNPNYVFSVSEEDAELLDDVVIAGFPLGKRVSSAIKTSKGSVTSLAGVGDNYSEFQTDAALNTGNSGGPMIDQKGNVVGVAVSKLVIEGVESFNFGIKVSTLKTFARSNSLTFLPPNSRDLSNSELGQLITNATLYLQCWMTVAQIKKMIAKEGNRKAFFSEFE